MTAACLNGPVEVRATPALLEIRNLTLAVGGSRDQVVVDNISFEVTEKSVFAIVGESGCGKSVTALSVLGLIEPAVRPLSGEILFQGEDLIRASERRMKEVRGGEISMIFQEPMTSLNPVLTVGYQIEASLKLHQSMNRRDARQTAIDLLSLVGIPSPEKRVKSYPHQMSGGMCQRAMIALALACEPRLLIADEPTTALDVTIQAQIIELLRSLRQKLGMTVIIITHDLGLVSNFADSVAVMYAGRIVERASAEALFRHPLHPYTQRLLASIPPVDFDVETLSTIEGTVPSPGSNPEGCKFAPRCNLASDKCRNVEPLLQSITADRYVACHYPQ